MYIDRDLFPKKIGQTIFHYCLLGDKVHVETLLKQFVAFDNINITVFFQIDVKFRKLISSITTTVT